MLSNYCIEACTLYRLEASADASTRTLTPVTQVTQAKTVLACTSIFVTLLAQFTLGNL